VGACETWRNSDEEVTERIVILENQWVRTRVQVDFIQHAEPVLNLDHDYQRVLDDTLGILSSKLSLAVSTIEGVLKKNSEPRPGIFGFGRRVRKGKYVLIKEALDDTIRDLEDWQRRFDPSWFLIMRMATPVIDQQLQEASVRARNNQWGRPSGAAAAGSVPGSSRPGGRPGRNARTPSQSPLTALELANGIRDALRPDAPHHSTFLAQHNLNKIDIPFSTAKAGSRGAGGGTTQWFIIDSLPCRPGSEQVLSGDVRELARKLSRAEPLTFGLLNCKGAMRMMDPTGRHLQGFDLILRIPDGMEILQSLRQVLLNAEANAHMSLTRRMRIAQQLAKSISYVHTFKFVHKNVCPESVLIFEDLDSKRSAAFLVGFDNFRSADGGTLMMGDQRWERNIYRHPERQGDIPENQYRMQHDIYSLGVCLLEIGMWESFVEYTKEDNPQPTHSKAYREFMSWVSDAAGTRERQPAGSAAYMSFVAYKLKDYLVKMAKERLPQRMGDRYAEVVETCLTCLDKGNNEFGDDYDDDPDGIHVGISYIENILGKLNAISI
jgi:hypothetical protein